MAERSHRPIPLAVIVFSLLVAGGLLFATVRSLSEEIAPTEAGALPALHAAAAAGDAQRVLELLGRDADVNQGLESTRLSESGKTPLLL
ncbi:MAG: hypothetical protein AAFP26_01445, partial [Planctomycetota bacterium]